jgi:hypothetical protein
MKITLLTTGNPKVAKGQANGYLTSILHLAPSRMSGYNTCPMATTGCAAACLNTAGRGGLFAGVSTGVMSGAELVQAIMDGKITNRIQLARIARTRFFFEDRAAFMKQLVREIKAAIRLAARHGLTPVFRLNGTSDIRWETVPVGDFANIMAMFPTVQFYDYRKTKIVESELPTNYHITFSRSETNDVQCIDVLNRGYNVAVVFRDKKLPDTWNGFPVVNGDNTDLRFLDPKGVVIGLFAKGKARKDTSGFVV